MATITIEVPDDAFAALRRSPEEFAREMRLAAAVRWYARGVLSQGKAAEVAGVSRREFLEALGREGVPASQATLDDLRRELQAG
jgi:predicted HTH domain antitoxin